MKVLFLSQGRQIDDHPGWNDSLVKLKNEGFISSFTNIPYFGYAEKHGWEAFYSDIVRLCEKKSFDVVYFHHFHNRRVPSPKQSIENLLRLNKRPVVITSVGDLFSYNWMMPYFPQNFKEASSLADITFSSHMGKAADKMVDWGAKNVVFSPLGMCQVRFHPEDNVTEKETKYDVVFLGSRANVLKVNPIHRAWWRAILRTMVVIKLHKSFKNKFGLFGRRWSFKYSNGQVPFNMQQNTFVLGRLAIDAPPSWCSDYYTSNRHLIQMASAVPTVMFETPRTRKLYRDNEHVYFVKFNNFIQRIKSILNEDKEQLRVNAITASKLVSDKHTQYHRMKFKLDTVKRYIANNYELDVDFPFFLPEVNLKEEMKYAVRVNKK